MRVEWFRQGSVWLSIDQVERFLEALYDLCERSDHRFQEACAFQGSDGYGPMIWLLKAMNQRQSLELLVKTMPLASRVSRYELEVHRPGDVRLTYTSQVPESRLLCLSRQAQLASGPRWIGLPALRVEEEQCLARGDPCCRYRLNYYERPGWLPGIAGLFVGAVLAATAYSFGLTAWYEAALLPLVAFLVTMTFAFRRYHDAGMRLSAEVQEALEAQVQENVANNAEIIDLQRRQQEWGEFVESQVRQRTETLEEVVQRLKSMQEERDVTLRGFTHDLRNPLTVLRAAIFRLEECPSVQEELPGIAQDLEDATDRMEALLSELMEIAMREKRHAGRVPTRVVISELGEKLQRRLRALVLGRKIKVSVITTREAPEAIDVDILIFDRILDNLFTNAAKYTEEGSILLEIGGRPGMLTLKLSDTGRGISEQRIEKIFEPGGSDICERAAASYGVGLSVVVRLVHEAGGKIEVMSRPGEGTTFWLHFPLAPPDREPVVLDDEQVLAKVLRIRRG